MNRHKIILAVALMLAAAVVPTKAQSTTYTYAGPEFTYFNGYACPSVCNISGPSPRLAHYQSTSARPISHHRPYSFTDGLNITILLAFNSRSGWKLLSGCSYKDGVLMVEKGSSRADCAAGIFLIQRPNCGNYEGFHGSGEKVPTVCKLLRT